MELTAAFLTLEGDKVLLLSLPVFDALLFDIDALLLDLDLLSLDLDDTDPSNSLFLPPECRRSLLPLWLLLLDNVSLVIIPKLALLVRLRGL